LSTSKTEKLFNRDYRVRCNIGERRPLNARRRRRA
jgi:hypothetical protein